MTAPGLVEALREAQRVFADYAEMHRHSSREGRRMIRVIIATTDAERAAHVGGPVDVSYKSFDIEAPEVEAFMRAGRPNTYWDRTLVGVELLEQAQ